MTLTSTADPTVIESEVSWRNHPVPPEAVLPVARQLLQRTGPTWTLWRHPRPLPVDDEKLVGIIVCVDSAPTMRHLQMVRARKRDWPRLKVVYDECLYLEDHLQSFALPEHLHWTLEEYLQIERACPSRHELIDGVLVAMAGGTIKHNWLESRITTLISPLLPPASCWYLGSDQLVARATVASPHKHGNARFSDGLIVCGRIDKHPEGETVLTNPMVWFEVLSPSNVGPAYEAKLAWLKTFPSLRQLVEVYPDEPRVVVHTRKKDCWTRRELGEGDQLELFVAQASIPVASIYEGIPDV